MRPGSRSARAEGQAKSSKRRKQPYVGPGTFSTRSQNCVRRRTNNINKSQQHQDDVVVGASSALLQPHNTTSTACRRHRKPPLHSAAATEVELWYLLRTTIFCTDDSVSRTFSAVAAATQPQALHGYQAERFHQLSVPCWFCLISIYTSGREGLIMTE